MRRDAMRLGMHVAHHPSGRYLGVIVDLRRRAVVRIARHGQPDVIATPHEIQPTSPPGDSPMAITKDRPRGGYRRPIQPGDRITTAWGRPLGVVLGVEGDVVRYENADGTEGGTFNRRQVRRVDDDRTTPTQAAAAAPPAPKGPNPNPKGPAKTPKVRTMRGGVHQYGHAVVSTTDEPDRRTGRDGNVIRVYAGGREVVIRVTPAGKNAAVIVDGTPIKAAK